MNSRQSKIARGLANAEAKRRGLWKQGESQVFAKWTRRLLVWLFPKKRQRYIDAVGRWYKANLKHWAKQAYAAIHERDAIAFAKAREKMLRREAHIRAMKAQEKRKAATVSDDTRPSPFDRM